MKRGRPKVVMLDDHVIAKLQKFIEFSGGRKSLARQLNISDTLIKQWLHKKSRPSFIHACAIEEMSNAFILADELNASDHIHTASMTFEEFIHANHLKEPAEMLGLTTEEYCNNFVPYIIKKIISNGYMSECDVPFMCAVFKKSNGYWRRLSRIYSLKSHLFIKD